MKEKKKRTASPKQNLLVLIKKKSVLWIKTLISAVTEETRRDPFNA